MFDYITYETEGQVSFIVNLMFFADIEIKRVKQTDKYCRFSVKSKFADKAEEILKKHEKEYKIVKNRSIKSFVLKNAQRFGLYVGLALVVTVLVIFSETITELKIGGTSLVDKETVEKATTSLYPLPSKKKEIDLDLIEKKLISIDGISNASLQIKGNVLYIEILEELEKPDVVDYNDKSPKTSKYDGVVEKVVVYSGTPAVKKGDVIKKGDTLILPTKTFADGEKHEVCALGDVYGRIWISKHYVVTPTVKTNERTGKKKSYLIRSRSDGNPKPPYKSYETEIIENYSVANLPQMRKITYYETREIEREFDYSKEKEKLIEEKTAALEKQIPEGAEKVRTWYTEKTLDKNVVLDIYYEIIVLLTE